MSSSSKWRGSPGIPPLDTTTTLCSELVMASKPRAYVESVTHDQLAVSHISSVFTLASFLSFQVLFWRTAEEGQKCLLLRIAGHPLPSCTGSWDPRGRSQHSSVSSHPFRNRVSPFPLCSPIWPPELLPAYHSSSHITYLTLALALLSFLRASLQLSHLLSDSGEPIKKGTVSIAPLSVSTVLLDVKLDGYRTL